ncbi:MAG TPA: rod shape-determining protein MreD [Firmicutes bacterium]|nr:rod shape-determining protein MreD [Bacillota bacterium]
MMLYIVPYLFYSLLGLCGIFLQAEFFSFIEIFHTKPDLILIFTVIAAIKTGWKNGGLAGAVMGFWVDLFIGGYFGVNIVVFGCTGMLFGFLAKRIKLNFYPGHFFSVCAGTLFSGFLYLICLNLIGVGLPWLSSIGGIIVPTAFYNAVLMLLAMPFIYLYRRFRGTKIAYVDLTGGGIILTSNNTPVDQSVIKRKKSNRKKRERIEKLKKQNRHNDPRQNRGNEKISSQRSQREKNTGTKRRKKKNIVNKRDQMKKPRSKSYERSKK